MSNYEVNSTNKVKRGAKRASYDKEVVNEILDAGFLCHVSYLFNGQPIAIPTAYGREGDRIFIHGAVANRMMSTVLEEGKASLTVTHLDGLVLARSAFHHSANYRSVAVFGKVSKVEDSDAKMHALKVIMDQMLLGRWEESRIPNEKELKATLVLEIKIDYASAKVRTGDPVDDEEDYQLPIWAGVLPVEQQYGAPIDDERLSKGIGRPQTMLKFTNPE